LKSDQHSEPGSPAACGLGAALMIVDDCDMLRRLWVRRLSAVFPHIQIDEAPHGKAAIELFEQRRHKVIILDCRMPVMDGPTAYGRIMELCRNKAWAPPNVIFWSTEAPSLAQLPDNIPPAVFVEKSNDPDTLVKTLTACLAAPPAGANAS
jgi:CheY-like chemotaxis protein